MDSLKRYLGVVWMLLGPAAMIALTNTAQNEIANHPGMDRVIQWGVFVIVFVPIGIGLVIFGWYAFTGAYDRREEDNTIDQP